MGLPAKIATIVGLVCFAAGPARAYCLYPETGGGAVAAGFMQIPGFSPEGAIATVRIGYQPARFGHASVGNSCRTDQGSKMLPLGPAPLGNACGFSLSDGSFVEGVVAP